MKASRLLHLLLLLQTRERMTTAELAERLEVSRRTVLRDVEALSAAGVPVYAERGRHGGIVLLPGARLNASHLDPGELEALSLAGLDRRRLRELGLSAVAEQAARKLAARQAASPDAAEPLDQLVVVDSAAWWAAPADVDVADLLADLRSRRRLELSYRRSGAERSTPVVVDPYGLAVKGGRWYLVADVEGAARLFAVERLGSYAVLPDGVRRREGHTLASVWAGLEARVERAGPVVVEARLRRSRLDLARRVLGSRLGATDPLDQEWCLVRIRYTEVEAVRQLLQLGDHVEVLAPEGARRRVHELARDLADRHASRAAPEVSLAPSDSLVARSRPGA